MNSALADAQAQTGSDLFANYYSATPGEFSDSSTYYSSEYSDFNDAFASAQKSANTVAIVVSIIFSLCCIGTIVIIVCCCCAAGKAVADANNQMNANQQNLLNQQ